MFKRLFWVDLGVVGVIKKNSKVQAYVTSKTPDNARQLLLGPDQGNGRMRTLEGLVNEFTQVRRTREAELNNRYIDKLQ